MTNLAFDYILDTQLLTIDEVSTYVAAQQIQFDSDFTPVWGTTVDCKFIPPGGQPRTGAMQLWFKDTSPTEGDLGFHTDDGQPMAYIFVASDRDDGVQWTVTASHESMEMAADPDINQTKQFTADDGKTYETPVEVADASEDDSYAYEINGQRMSAFVLPSWFDPAGAAPFTYPPIAEIDAPFKLASGGYMGMREIAPVAGQWTQQMAQTAGPRQVKRATSRTMRRFAAA